jgi:hypothetical protein
MAEHPSHGLRLFTGQGHYVGVSFLIVVFMLMVVIHVAVVECASNISIPAFTSPSTEGVEWSGVYGCIEVTFLADGVAVVSSDALLGPQSQDPYPHPHTLNGSVASVGDPITSNIGYCNFSALDNGIAYGNTAELSGNNFTLSAINHTNSSIYGTYTQEAPNVPRYYGAVNGGTGVYEVSEVACGSILLHYLYNRSQQRPTKAETS